jgi:hypothetical protein
MPNLLNDLVASPWFTHALTLAIGFISARLTIRYGMMRRLRYRCKSFCLIFESVNKVPGLEVKFHGFGPPVEKVTVSKVALWNAGRGSVRKSDVLGRDNIRLIIDPTYVILATEVIQQNNPLNNFALTVAQDRKSANIRFEFINPAEGAVIKIVHTGTNSSDLSLSGTIADAGPIQRTSGGQPDSGAPTSRAVPLNVGLITGSLLTILMFYALYVDVKPDPEIMRLARWQRLVIAFGLIAATISILGGEIILLNRIGRLPKGLEKFDEQIL